MEPTPVIVEEQGTGWGGVILIIFVLIIVFILIGLAIWEFSTFVGTRTLGETCSGNGCIPGLVCDRGICRADVDGHCDTLADCTANSTACFNHVCVNSVLSDIGGKAPCKAGLINDRGICKAPNGGNCHKNCDCLHGFECKHGKCRNHEDRKIRGHRRDRRNRNHRGSQESEESSSDDSSSESSSSVCSEGTEGSSSSSGNSKESSGKSSSNSSGSSRSPGSHSKKSSESSGNSKSSSNNTKKSSGSSNNFNIIPTANDQPEESIASIFQKMSKTSSVFNMD